jgi:membrane protein
LKRKQNKYFDVKKLILPMRIFKKSNQYIFRKWVRPILEWAKKVTFPGFDQTPIYNVGTFFFKGIRDGAIETRAAAVSFNLFLSLFPTMIFIFTLIPVLPIRNFQTELLLMIQSVVPETAYGAIRKTIEEIIIIPHGGLLSFGFVLALYFSTNGVVSLIQSFNASVNVSDTRSWLALRFVSLILVVILALLVTSSITLITFTQKFLHFLVHERLMRQNFTYYLITIGKWIVILALFYFAYSFLYYLGPARKSKWRFISAGGTLATFLSIIVTLGFSFYIDHFGKYNALYGSIGTLPVIMLMVYFNCLAIIIGFELNVGIVAARRLKNNQNNGVDANAIKITLQQPLSSGPEFYGNKDQ